MLVCSPKPNGKFIAGYAIIKQGRTVEIVRFAVTEIIKRLNVTETRMLCWAKKYTMRRGYIRGEDDGTAR